MSKLNKTSKISLLLSAIGILCLSFFGIKLFIYADLIPYLVFFLAAAMATMMLIAIYMAKWNNRFGNLILALGIINTAVAFSFQTLQDQSKVIYPFCIWVFVFVIITSVQRYLEVQEKPMATVMKFTNYGLLVLLLPLLLVKFSNPGVWNIVGIISALVLGIDVLLALMPSRKD